MIKPTRIERFRYWFDGYMSRGVVALIGLLAVVTLVFVVIVAGIVALFALGPAEDPAISFDEAMWMTLMRTLDPGTMGGDEGTSFRAAMLIVTFGGLIVVASLIGVVANAFDTKVEQLRKGNSRVLESDHTVILGWSPKVFSIVHELAIANESRRRAAIVILAEGDKLEMEEELHSRVRSTGRTRVIVRSGNPMNLTDLDIVSPHQARSIIILAPEGHDDPDAVVVKTALAITNNPGRKTEKYNIVAELEGASYIEAARLVGRDEAHWVLASDLISRITVQSIRQSGLSSVYAELLTFDGDEIYFTDQPALTGRTFYQAQLAFSDTTVIGLVHSGETILNPDAGTIIANGDQLVVVAEDDSTIRVSGNSGVPDTSVIVESARTAIAAERTLVLGYNPSLHLILQNLDENVSSPSAIQIVADVDEPTFAALPNLAVSFRRADTTSRAVLEELDASSFDHVVVLAYTEHLDIQQADTKTLITLLHLRDLEAKAGTDLNIVSEMLDDGNRELAEVTKADDFIVSDKLVSLMLSQVSESRQLTEVFDHLFVAEGSEIYLRPASLYVTIGAPVSFYTVIAAASRRGETALGYRIGRTARSAADKYGVRVNPAKGDVIAFAGDDHIIVLAED
jgi:ion channel POLLUX/CASTOR